MIGYDLTRVKPYRPHSHTQHLWAYVLPETGEVVQRVFVRVGKREILLKPLDSRHSQKIKKIWPHLEGRFFYHARGLFNPGWKWLSFQIKTKKEKNWKFSERIIKVGRAYRQPIMTNLQSRPVASFQKYTIKPMVWILEGVYWMATFLGHSFRFVILMNPERLGHLTPNTENYLAESQLNLHGTIPRHLIFFVPKYTQVEGHGYIKVHDKIANRALLAAWSQKYWILYEGIIPIEAIRRLARRRPGAVAHMRNHGHRDIHGCIARTSSSVALTVNQLKEGEATLASWGIKPHERFVCFHYRTSEYVQHLYRDLDNSLETARYGYRNVQQDDYQPALEYLIDQGYWVIRMGADKSPWNFSHPRAVDYSSRYYQNWLDLYLFSKCDFFVGTTSGTFSLAELFRKPIVFTNFAPIGHVHSWSEWCLTIFKKLKDTQSCGLVSMMQQVESEVGWSVHAEKVLSQRYVYLDNTPQEIKEVVQEMVERLKGTWKETAEDRLRAELFWSAFPASQYHSYIRAKVGAKFLEQNADWILREIEAPVFSP